MKTVIFVNPKRVAKYKEYCDIPAQMELVMMDVASSDQEVVDNAGNADFIFTDVIKEISADLIEQMPNLKMIHSEGVGYNRIHTEAAKQRNIYVCNNMGVNAGAVAEHTIMLMLAMLKNLLEGDAQVRAGKQIQTKERMILEGIKEIADCHVGLIGLGAIGIETLKRLAAFGTKIGYNDCNRNPQLESEYNIGFLSLDDLLATSDIVSLHIPVTVETTNMVNKDFLNKMKNSGILINTARGELVDQVALREALISRQIAGVAVDTLTPEPVTLDNPLLSLPESARYKILFTPHVAGTTEGAFRKMHQTVWNNINAVIKNNRPTNIVNGL
ncbi:MAG: 2-hydroxyacid dehydrogenase [Firmicutes bacterium]|nr:2-hydroxyacid dehydrogenase [Bacillota bacterium]